MAVNIKALSKFDSVTLANQGAWLTLLDTAGKLTEQKIKLLGPHSTVWQKGLYKDDNLARKAAEEAGRAYRESREEREEDFLKRMIDITAEWQGFPDDTGGDAP